MRNKKLKQIKSLPDMSKDIEYNEMIRSAIISGKEQKDFNSAMNLLNKAYEILPDRTEAIWGRATVYCIFNDYENSIVQYNILLKMLKNKDYNSDYIQKIEFERLLVLLNIDIDKALKDLIKLIDKNNTFSYFLKNIAKIYGKQNKTDEAIKIYNKYLKLFPYDDEAKEEMAFLSQ
jgi:tetratricopeptide (TPR) repeat protein